MCWTVYHVVCHLDFLYLFLRRGVELRIISNVTRLERCRLMRCRSCLAHEFMFAIVNTLVCLLRIRMENLTLTRRGWRPWTYTVTNFKGERVVSWVGLFNTYWEIRERIVKGVGITYKVINYTSPTYTRETSEFWHGLSPPLRIVEPKKGKILLENRLNTL